MPTDHHSAYLQQTIAALTPEGRGRADELLDQLVQAAGGHERVVRFADVLRTETDTGLLREPEGGFGLTSQELDVLGTGFRTIRDTEQRDDVTDWAVAVYALIEDEADAAH
jgi:hypothetical protein